MSLFEELIEGKKKDKQIVKSFETKETLSDQIFEEKKGHFVMRDEIKKRLLEVSNDFIESLGVEFFIHDVVLTGSLANYNWSQYSDVDLHILIDFDELDKDSKKDSIALHSIMKEFFDAKKNVWNEKHEIKIKGYDVEIYVQDVNEEHISSGVYSILHNKWVLEPKKDKPNIDDRKILEKGEEYAKMIDDLSNESEVGEINQSQVDDLKSKIKKSNDLLCYVSKRYYRQQLYWH